MTILPKDHRTPCLRCIFPDPPPTGSQETCDTAGVIGPAVNVVASLEAVTAMKILAGGPEAVEPKLTIVDVWEGTLRQMNVADLRETSNCPACHEGKREWLDGKQGAESTVLCGRNSVQVSPPNSESPDFERLKERLQGVGSVSANKFLLRLKLNSPDYEVTVFRDGRAIIQGTEDPAVARGIYARYIGT